MSKLTELVEIDADYSNHDEGFALGFNRRKSDD